MGSRTVRQKPRARTVEAEVSLREVEGAKLAKQPAAAPVKVAKARAVRDDCRLVPGLHVARLDR